MQGHTSGVLYSTFQAVHGCHDEGWGQNKRVVYRVASMVFFGRHG